MMSLRWLRFIDTDDLKEGDIVDFVRAGGLYSHCGIYDGNNGVIHRAADPGAGSGVALDARGMFAKLGIESDKAEIRRDDLREVAGSSAVYRTNMYDSVMQPFPSEEVLRRAKERLGEKGYNIIHKNCQHFCTEARYGVPMNMEIEANFGLRTGYSYLDTRILVNTVKLDDMPIQSYYFQPESYMILPTWQPGHPELKENVNIADKSDIPAGRKDFAFDCESSKGSTLHTSVGTSLRTNNTYSNEYVYLTNICNVNTAHTSNSCGYGLVNYCDKSSVIDMSTKREYSHCEDGKQLLIYVYLMLLFFLFVVLPVLFLFTFFKNRPNAKRK